MADAKGGYRESRMLDHVFTDAIGALLTAARRAQQARPMDVALAESIAENA